MRLLELSVDSVRNLRGVQLRPHPRLTVLIGDNGHGKTNLLEAIHLSAALRPLRAVERASDLVAFGASQGLIRARFDVDGPLDVEVALEPRGRRATIGGKAVRDVASLASRIGVVSFTPDDADFIRGGPAERRRGLDRFAFSLWPSFARVVRHFEDALERRNRVLKTPGASSSMIDAYTPPFVEAAVELARARARACALWAPAFAAEAFAIGGDALSTSLRYDSGSSDDDALDTPEDALRARLHERLDAGRDTELRRGATCAGPHHDDVVVTKGDRRARFLASQGEARALVLALKLATVRLATAERGTGPLLLLDDVAGELDATRAGRLLRAVDECGAQAFVTTTHEGTLPPVGDAAIVVVRNGAIVAQPR